MCDHDDELFPTRRFLKPLEAVGPHDPAVFRPGWLRVLAHGDLRDPHLL